MPDNALQHISTKHHTSRKPRGRPRLPAEKRRTHSLRLRLNQAELARLEYRAERAGEALATFCRHAALDQETGRGRTDQTALRQLRQLRRDLFFALENRHPEPVRESLEKLLETADELLEEVRDRS